ncbi:MAG: hypothetical protein J2P37_31300 [Ktedonobacteraceae bacterium]|nr:hypothetical protein [Ktedonobacteraceae bacterium]
MQARRIWLQEITPAYHRASGFHKQRLLVELVTSTGMVYTYALWLLNYTEKIFAPPTLLRRSQGEEA